MELVKKYKECGYFNADIYYLLAYKKLPYANHPESLLQMKQIIPSHYEKEIKMSTAERLQTMNSMDVDNFVSSTSKDKKRVLSFTPKIMIFQNFESNKKIVTKFTVRNISNKIIFVRMADPNDPYFTIKATHATGRLAGGISTTYTVTFVPALEEDYLHSLMFYTETDEYCLPLIALGPRPLFSFPDKIAVPETVLKIEGSIEVPVKNIGNTIAGFTIKTNTPFFVDPMSAHLHPKEKAYIKVGLKTINLGEINGILNVEFETGEVLQINVLGKTYTASVRLERDVVIFEDTFNTMARQRTFTITNNSDRLLTYMCMKNMYIYRDFADKVDFAVKYNELKKSELQKCTKLAYYDVVTCKEHERVYMRIFFDEVQSLIIDETLQFRNENFSIWPIQGQLWPKKSTELTIFFAPKIIGEFEAVVYIDIEGVEERLPLKMVGTSLPPLIQLDIEILDMEKVYIDKKYNYEVVATNKGFWESANENTQQLRESLIKSERSGCIHIFDDEMRMKVFNKVLITFTESQWHINGVVEYRYTPSLFDSIITCTPEMLCLRPGEKEIFTISYYSANQGDFFEEVKFIIRDTKVVLKIYLKGEVIYPTVTFNIPCLDFGTVSVGVPKTLEVKIINESIIFTRGKIKVSSDGSCRPGVTLDDCMVDENINLNIIDGNMEFQIEPSVVEIGPTSSLIVKVTLTANIARKNNTLLELQVDRSNSPPIALPLTYIAAVPTITRGPDINIKTCFLGCIYDETITLYINEYWGYFHLKELPDDTDLKIEVLAKRGLIKPNSTVTLPIKIQSFVVGKHEQIVRIFLFGQNESIDVCNINVVVNRPIVICTPLTLQWGPVKTLTQAHKDLTLYNDSPVSVNFCAQVLNQDPCVEIVPITGSIDPEDDLKLVVNLFLRDSNTYTNKILIRIEKIKDMVIPLHAVGTGTSIYVSEDRDRVHLGRHFTKQPIEVKVPIINHGTRVHLLEWSDLAKANKTQNPVSPKFFDLQPRNIKVMGQEQAEMTVTAFSNVVKCHTETWYLFGTIEGVNKKECLLECPISIEFVEPKIEVSSSRLDFIYNCGPYSQFYKLTDVMIIKNISLLPLNIEVSVKSPFAFLQKTGSYKIDSEYSNLCTCFDYDESNSKMESILNALPSLESTNYIDCVTSKPIKRFNKRKLKFHEDIHQIKAIFDFTNGIEEHLEDQEIMGFHVLFDISKHNSLRSKTYNDCIRVRMRGLKDKHQIKLIGKMNYPNVSISTRNIDFGCVMNGALESKSFKIYNSTPLVICYNFSWHVSKTVVIEDLNLDQAQQPSLSSSSESSTKYNQEEVDNKNLSQNVLKKSDSKDKDNIKQLELQDIKENTDYKEKISSTEENKTDLQSQSNGDKEEKCFVESNKSQIGIINEKDSTVNLLRKISPMINDKSYAGFPWEKKLPVQKEYNPYEITEIFQVIPHRGRLKAEQSQQIHIIFKPLDNIIVNAVLECSVLGGPSESVTVTGQSSRLVYELSSSKLNFKIRSFHEDATEILTLFNTARLPFDYKTYMIDPEIASEFEGVINDIQPPLKHILSKEIEKIHVIVKPGIVGYFHRQFLLEIGFEPRTTIDVSGWGVFPQMYLCLRRPAMLKSPIMLGYKAIPILTSEYLAAVNEIFGNDESGHFNTPQEDKCLEDPDLKDWHICSVLDALPSVMDIEMAIERKLVIDYIETNDQDVLAIFSKNLNSISPIPGFVTIPYEIDFGVVIIGIALQSTIDVINYGPIPIKLHLQRMTRIPAYFTIRLCGKVNPGDTGKIEIVFNPSVEYFTYNEEIVELVIYLEIPYGVSIPLQIKALCAVPYLKANLHEIKFGTVKCGDKSIISIALKNVSKAPCIWYVTLKGKSVHAPAVMKVLDDPSGKYERGEQGWLRISFKPLVETTYRSELVFRFHMNPNKLIIPVTGKGVQPVVHIIGPNITFPPTLPWADLVQMYFGFTNPCPFPIEVIIAHTDKIWKEEEEIMKLLAKFYDDPEEILVPIRKPGMGLPEKINIFFEMFRDTVKKVMAAEDAAAAKAEILRAKAKAKAKLKKPNQVEKPVVFKKKTVNEIIAATIKSLKASNFDPLAECFTNVGKSPLKVSEEEKGLIILMHSAPGEEVQSHDLAYSIGLHLKLPVISIDSAFVEALCVCTGPAQVSLLNAINDLYDTTREKDLSTDLLFNGNEDEFEIIWKKIEYLESVKFKTGSEKTKKGDNVAKKKKNEISTMTQNTLDAMGSTHMFQTTLVDKLMTEFLALEKFDWGFVVDSLSSMILRTPSQVIITILNCKRIRNVQLMLCHSDFNRWVATYEKALHEKEAIEEKPVKIYNEIEIENIVKDIEAMDDKEFEKAPPELLELYIFYGLAKRRQKFETVNKRRKLPTKDLSLFNRSTVDTKKKIKKEDSPKGRNISGKAPEYQSMLAKFNEYKGVYESVVNIANNWIFEEGDVGSPLYGLNCQPITGGNPKKTPNIKRSEHSLDTQTSSNTKNGEKRGFPLTLIMAPSINFKMGVINWLTRIPFIMNILREKPEKDITKTHAKMMGCTQLLLRNIPKLDYVPGLDWYFLTEPLIKKCDCNNIDDIRVLDDTTQELVINILKKWHCTCGKNVSSQSSISDYLNIMTEGAETPESLEKVNAATDTIERIVMQYGDLVRCQYTFCPEKEGKYSVKRYLEVSGWPASRVVVNVEGICDIPRLDTRPKKMFQNFVRRTLEDNVYKMTYLDDEKLFQFGPIFIAPKRVLEEETTMNLRNASLLPAAVEIEFLEDTSLFRIDVTKVELEVGEQNKLTISAAPERVGQYTSILLFSVKNNPEIIELKISCSGVLPIVDLLPQSKIIDFGKHLLYRREEDRFIVKNDSILPIKWTIRDEHEFLEDFILPKTEGIIFKRDNEIVPITYIACKVGVISHKVLTVDIFDVSGRGEPLATHTLQLNAECYDITVECTYLNSSETYLNYGTNKVNSIVQQQMFLKNVGKYSVIFKLTKVEKFPVMSFLKTFKATPDCGILVPDNSTVTVEVKCQPAMPVNMVNVPVYTCALLDGTRDQVVVAQFPVCVTIASFYNTFTLFPLGELNFDIIPVNGTATKEIILNNTSKCPFTYEIIIPEQYRMETPVGSIKSTKTQPKSGKTIKLPPLKCGNFVINNEDNLVIPGGSRAIRVEFIATSVNKFEETINFIISDTCPAEYKGVPLKLVGTGSLPSLDFWNFNITFREQLNVKNIEDYDVMESQPHCVFEEDKVTLHFLSVTVGFTFPTNIYLYNNGLVIDELKMTIHYQPNTEPSVFQLEKYEDFIEPLRHKRLEICFTPKALQKYRACLEISLTKTKNEIQTFKLCLIGEGSIPRVKLVSPPLGLNCLSVLTFPMTCLGSTSYKVIKFEAICNVKSSVRLQFQSLSMSDERPEFSAHPAEQCEHMLLNTNSDGTDLTMTLEHHHMGIINVAFNPLRKGKAHCDIQCTIIDNPFESFTVMCEAEAFMEDVMLLGLVLLSMEDTGTTSSTAVITTKRSKTAQAKIGKSRKSIVGRKSINADVSEGISNTLRYVMDFGGCELCIQHKRSVIMVNNSEKVYRFTWEQWEQSEYFVIKPLVGYISPGEEKDIEIIFYSFKPYELNKEPLQCTVVPFDENDLFLLKDRTWDDRQTMAVIHHKSGLDLNERAESPMIERNKAKMLETSNTIIILVSVATNYSQYTCTLIEKIRLKDTYIYQSQSFEFEIKNIGIVAMKINWNFRIDDEYPTKAHKNPGSLESVDDSEDCPEHVEVASKETLFGGRGSKKSVDTWFEVDLPFTIEPSRACLQPSKSQTFKVIFSPMEAFDFTVTLTSSIEHLDPYDDNVSCLISAKSLISYVHLDIEKSNYLETHTRNEGSIILPSTVIVLEFNVLGEGCYHKPVNVINPSHEGYEFIIQNTSLSSSVLIPVHCNIMKSFLEAGTSKEVVFTFAPSKPGIYESLWQFYISAYGLTLNLLVVGIVREPNVEFKPQILSILNSYVGFTSTHVVNLINKENEYLNFSFAGHSMYDESGKGTMPAEVEPAAGVLKPLSQTPITVHFTPVIDKALAFKIYYKIDYLVNNATICINTFSLSISSFVTYNICGVKHVLDSKAITEIHLEQTASGHNRIIPFTITNDGSGAFLYQWCYSTFYIKDYLTLSVEPHNGNLAPGNEVECVLTFNLKEIPCRAFPVKLKIINGLEYEILFNADIHRPKYEFSCDILDFGNCLVNAPDGTYIKKIVFKNLEKVPVILEIIKPSLPDFYVDYKFPSTVPPRKKRNIDIHFRPTEMKRFTWPLEFYIDTLCSEIVNLTGHGVPLLIDIYEACEKRFDFGPVKVGERVKREVEVLNQSRLTLDIRFQFKAALIKEHDTVSEASSMCLDPNTANIASIPGPSRVVTARQYREETKGASSEKDIRNALSSLKVMPVQGFLRPHMKIKLTFYYKPITLISSFNVQLTAMVLDMERPLAVVTGSATGASFCLNQDSIQFGNVRKFSMKVLKIMLINKGDFSARYWWQPLISEEFKIVPMKGRIEARQSVPFTITLRPLNFNPFIKVWACCEVENYKSMEVAMYAACTDAAIPISQTVTFECPVRETQTNVIPVVNNSNDEWEVKCLGLQPPFIMETFLCVKPRSTYNVVVKFQPQTIGKHVRQVMLSPCGVNVLLVTFNGVALPPIPNGSISFTVPARETHTEALSVYNSFPEHPEMYSVETVIEKIIPDRFTGYYEINHPDRLKVWGEAVGTCPWSITCFEECAFILHVRFVNIETREYQVYEMNVTVTSGDIIGTLTFVCLARESVQQSVVISNPLDVVAMFDVNCETLKLKQTVQISRKTAKKIPLVYAPLVVGTTEDYVTITHNVVGTCMYKVLATCLPAKEKFLEYKISLGESLPVRCRISNGTDILADFISSVTHPCVAVDGKYQLLPLEKRKIMVWLEPTNIGLQTCRLSFASAIAGEFVFNINIRATKPQPQGPFVIKQGGFIAIDFKNVFEETKTFDIKTHQPEFHVRSQFEELGSKKKMKVIVYHAKLDIVDIVKSGCLSIDTTDDPPVRWTYFLQGLP